MSATPGTGRIRASAPPAARRRAPARRPDGERAVAPRAGGGTRRRAAGGHAHAALGGLTLAALGVVFGDTGTSPLYAIQTVFAIDGGVVRPTHGDVYGVISLVFWAITVVVSAKYVSFVMRADNEGEGGIMALTALVQRALSLG